MDEVLSEKVKEWFKWDQNSDTRQKLQKLLDAEEYSKLRDTLLNRIKFGTAGLRGKMDFGYTCLNDLVIIQTAQGWCKFLQTNRLDLLEKNGIVVGYDGRYNSKRWAELTASIFVNSGYRVKLFSDCVPTPFISFTISTYGCAGGVMVTASHNPKDDNGYKVYDSNACQIINPVDRLIQQLILENLDPWPLSWKTTVLHSRTTLIIDPMEEITRKYNELVCESIPREILRNNNHSDLVFTYSAMHGVGYKYVKMILDAINVKMIAVPEQRDPDPEFSTVKFPNPEEGASSLDLSFKTADANESFLIIANDPDADRFAFAEKNKSTGQWKIFSGNELGAIFGWWMLYCYKVKYPTESMNGYYMMSSTVSSMILKTMSKMHGFHFLDTLTGFKWMGNKVLELERENKKVIFGYEVEIGFMCINKVLDKDGVSAAAYFTTMCNYLYRNGQQVADKLNKIYSEYGYHVCRNSYFSCSSADIIKRIFENLRNYTGPNKYPEEIFNGKYKIISVRDLTTGYDSSQPNKKAILPLSPEMITFTFDNGLICTIRTSGTEPKIKYYTELCATPDIKNIEEVKTLLNTMVDEILNVFLQPVNHGLETKAEYNLIS